MTKLEQLINELCPEGIEYKKIKEVSNFRRGSFPQPYTNLNFYGGEGSMPFVQVADLENDSFNLKPKTNQTISLIAQPKSIFVERGTILVSIQGTIGRVAITQYDSYVDRTIAIFSYNKDLLNKRFFAYCLKQKFAIEKENARGSTLKTITKEEFSEFEIPVPPLPIQEEIVRILDNFTELTSELTSELTARKQQYNYYRDKLLNYDSVKCKEMTILDMLSQPITDGPHETPVLVEDGVPFLSAESIINNKLDFNHKRGFITREYDNICAKKYKPQRNDVYMCKSGSTTGKVAINDTDIDFNIWSPLAAMRVNEHNCAKFLFYLLQSDSVQNQVKTNASHGSQPNLSMRKLEQFKVCVPPLEIQQRIVDVLDNFEAICFDLNIGLPAEIEARQKQYEYYRNKLLNFKRIN